jgi:thiamine transport system substrate-binding protein
MSKRTTALILAVGVLFAACGSTTDQQESTSQASATTTPAAPTTTEAPDLPDTLTIISHDSFAGGVTDETFAAFTTETGIEVEVLPAGDAGSMTNQAILTKDNPVADVLFGIDDSFLSRAFDEGIFDPYESPLLADVPERLQLDPENRVTPIDYGDVCVNYDVSAYATTRPPLNIEQLANPEFAGDLVVESPATSSPGLAFLLATIATFGEEGWQDYWTRLVDNGVNIVSDWDTAYYQEFSHWGGPDALVVSYASSPPAEVIYADPPVSEAPTGVIDETCYRQIEFAGILAGSDSVDAARLLVDFMLSPGFQESIPLTWFVFPATESAALPQEFIDYTIIPASPISLDPALVEANRERWIEEWSELVLGS